MRKRVWFLLSLLTLTVACVVLIINQKPSEADFAKWMEKTYKIQCLDYNCHTFQLDVTDDKEPILMQSVHGGYSPGIFVMKLNHTYRNLNDSSYILNIEVEGFFGDFKIKDETIKYVLRN